MSMSEAFKNGVEEVLVDSIKQKLDGIYFGDVHDCEEAYNRMLETVGVFNHLTVRDFLACVQCNDRYISDFENFGWKKEEVHAFHIVWDLLAYTVHPCKPTWRYKIEYPDPHLLTKAPAADKVKSEVLGPNRSFLIIQDEKGGTTVMGGSAVKRWNLLDGTPAFTFKQQSPRFDFEKVPDPVTEDVHCT